MAATVYSPQQKRPFEVRLKIKLLLDIMAYSTIHCDELRFLCLTKTHVKLSAKK